MVCNPKIIRDHDENLTDLAKKLDILLQENENYFDTSSDLIDFIESIKEIEDKKFSVFLLRHIVIFLLSHCRHLLSREFERQNISHRDIEKIIIENQHKDSFYYNRKSIFLLLYFSVYLLDNNKINKNEVENILEINVDFLKENFPHQVWEYNFFPDIDRAINFWAYEDAAESISHCYQALEDDGLYSEEEMVEKTDELRGKIMLTIIHYFEPSTY